MSAVTSTLAINSRGQLVIMTLVVTGVARVGTFYGFLTRLNDATVTTD